jgi:hypothetical protein
VRAAPVEGNPPPGLAFAVELLEREGALDALGRALESAARGDGRFVLLPGEAGIGRLRAARAPSGDAVARAAGRGLFARLALLRQLLEQHAEVASIAEVIGVA